MSGEEDFVLPLSDIARGDVAKVGGKNVCVPKTSSAFDRLKESPNVSA